MSERAVDNVTLRLRRELGRGINILSMEAPILSLIAEDDDAIAAGLALNLKIAGYATISAQDGNKKPSSWWRSINPI